MVAFPVIWPHAEVRGQTLTQEEALELAFSGADSIVRRTAYLDQADLERAGQLAGEEARPDASVLSYYVALRGTQPMGVAYFDAHRVRTLPEILMVVVDPEARIRRIEVVRFSEPPEYRPPEGWLELFEDRSLDADLAHKRAIPNMTGATLTARAATLATRRVLALHAVIEPFLEWDG
jgi:hypothetical protein